MTLSENTTVGFIGVGVMGRSMASHLMKAGYEVVVYNRTKEKALSLIEEGAKWKDTVKEVAQVSNVIITIVGYPKDVEEVYLGENGLLNHARAGTYFLDMTTSSPSLAVKIYEEAKRRKMHALDAPVSGGDVGAKLAKLAIMVGGDENDFQEVLPILEKMGENIIHQGNAGSGQHTKMCNQIAIAPTMIGVCEAIVYAEKAGLSPKKVLQTIETGAAGSFSLSKLAPRMINGDFEPGFYVKHFIKDMTIALQSAEEMGILTPGLKLAKQLYEQLAERGEENSGTQALYKLYN
ncbi:oxidoreductase [Anaerobacillus alkalidiazotrophicus]|uniref:Oxidoreductase n=1 Tax=Anaerobacillus alkalidiazotrophicus TaxID=472963 RepID=A0A1S2MB86_9BACI|nr:NAD(P)-dependent oxidoreductase [Anaerobacillus alkalidiazotrophicus]OIJ21836.1 oxidoreductase [Anaerobacillus alkalidiazotrophicus]